MIRAGYIRALLRHLQLVAAVGGDLGTAARTDQKRACRAGEAREIPDVEQRGDEGRAKTHRRQGVRESLAALLVHCWHQLSFATGSIRPLWARLSH